MINKFFMYLSDVNSGITKISKGESHKGYKLITEGIDGIRKLYNDNQKELDESFTDIKTFILSLELCELNRIKTIVKIERSLLKRYNLTNSSVNNLEEFYRKNRKFIDFEQIAMILDVESFIDFLDETVKKSAKEIENSRSLSRKLKKHIKKLASNRVFNLCSGILVMISNGFTEEPIRTPSCTIAGAFLCRAMK